MKKFTLIELITVVAILGIIASIIIPNFSDQKEKAIATGIKSNIRSLQTSADLYALDNNNAYPTKVAPTIDQPQVLDYSLLYPKYMTKIPKEWKTEKYWVDVWGRVWGSTIDAPTNVHIIKSGGKQESLSWENQSQKVGYNVGYEVYNVDQFKMASAAVRPDKTHWKISDLFNPKPTTKIINYRMQNKEQPYTLVSATDMYGLATPPVGEGYEGVPDFIELENGNKPESPYFPEVPQTFPITDVGTYYVTTNAHGLATWLGITKSEVKPAGTDIKYSFATDAGSAAGAVNNKKCGAFGAYTDDITKLPQSQCMKVKVEMIGTEDIQPTLNNLKVIFNVSEEEESEEIITKHKPQAPQTWAPGETEKTVTEIIDLPGKDKVTDVKPIITLPPGTSAETNYSTHDPDTGKWSEPTPFPEQLPPGDKVKQETVLKKDDPKAEDPKLEETIVSSRPPHANEEKEEVTEEVPVDEWVTIDTMNLQFDAGQKGNWTSVEITDKQPDGTRINYEYSTSDNGSTWSAKADDISKAADSQFIKVDITRQHKKDVTEKPVFIEILINYELGDGTKKQVKLVNDDLTDEIQAAVDKYKADKGNYPSTTQPSKSSSQPIDFSKLIPSYLGFDPTTTGTKYFVDFAGKVWGSTLNPITLSAMDTTLNWTPATGASKYTLYQVSGNNLAIASSGSTTTYPNATRGKEYVVTATDSNGLETAPSNAVTISSVGAPTAATISAGTPTSTDVQLTFSVTGTADSIELYRNGTKVQTLAGTATSANETGLAPSTSYSYYIIAKNAAGSKQSNTVSVTTTAPPAVAPTAATISAGTPTTTSVNLNLSVTGSADSIELYRNGAKVQTLAGTATSASETGLSPATTYSYYIIAKNTAGSVQSNTVVVTTVTPAAPTAVTISNTAKTDTTATISVTGGTGATSYTLYRNGAYAGTVNAGSNVISGLAGSTTYSFYVVAANAGGSVNSNTISVTTNASPANVGYFGGSVGGVTNLLYWGVSDSTQTIQLYRSVKGGTYSLYKTFNKTDQPTILDRSLTVAQMGVTSYYIKACNTLGCSAQSNVVTGTNVELSGGASNVIQFESRTGSPNVDIELQISKISSLTDWTNVYVYKNGQQVATWTKTQASSVVFRYIEANPVSRTNYTAKWCKGTGTTNCVNQMQAYIEP